MPVKEKQCCRYFIKFLVETEDGPKHYGSKTGETDEGRRRYRRYRSSNDYHHGEHGEHGEHGDHGDGVAMGAGADYMSNGGEDYDYIMSPLGGPGLSHG